MRPLAQNQTGKSTEDYEEGLLEFFEEEFKK